MSNSASVMATGVSISAARRSVADEFRRHGCATPSLDARVLLAHALGLDHAGLVTRSAHRLAADEARTIARLTARRLRGEPVARILGCKEFWGLPLQLDRATLVPRPETETVVEAALALLDHDGLRRRPLRIADLGTGSGALLLALLSELPASFGVGSDVDAAALACARANAGSLGLSGRTAFVLCDWGAALASPFDVVVANPPYVARGELAALAPEVRDFDPPRALDGGPDGLDAYRAIARDAPQLLGAQGCLVVELGAGQGEAVASILAARGLRVHMPARDDLAGIARALVARPPP